MTTEKNLREELLRQDNASHEKADDFRNSILKADEMKVVRMRKVVLVAWAVTITSVLAAVTARVLFPDITEWRPELVPAFILVFQGLLLIAVILTVSLYIRERTLTMHQLQTSLAMIEEHLRKMAQKD
jgi:cell division protein FtsL